MLGLTDGFHGIGHADQEMPGGQSSPMQLRDMVLARRSEGNENVVGSVWDGADCARLFVAEGLLDPETGEPARASP